MWVYYLFIIIIILCFLIDYKVKTKLHIFEKIGISLPIIFGFVRYGFGNDYETYKVIHTIINGNTVNLQEAYIRQVIRMEYGFKVLNLYIKNFQILIGIITLFNIILIYKTIKYFFEKKTYLPMIIYICVFQLYFYNLSAIRQSIASALFFYSSRYIVEKKMNKFIFLILLGSLFHKSLLLLLPIYFIYKIEIYKSKKKIIILLFIVGSILYIKFNPSLTIVIMLLKKLGFLRFVYELEKVPEKTELLTIMVFIGNIIYLGIILFFYPSKTKKDKIIYNFMIITVTFSLLKILRISAFHRLENYFLLFETIAIPRLIYEYFYRKKSIIVINLILIYLIFFNIRMIKQNKESENYKTMKTIFFIDERH